MVTHILWKFVFSASSALVAFGCWKLGERVWHNLTSPLRALPGPKGTSWLYGNLKDIFNAENSVLHEQWVGQYGTTLKYKGFFFSDRLFTMDTRALNHVLTHSSDYQKPSQVRYNLSRILGEGVLFVEGAQHRQQRRIMNPAFGPAQIRALTDIFISKSIKLRDVWSTMTVASEHATRIDIMPWLSKMTLDVIGLAGFNYEFDALNATNKPNELNQAFTVMFSAGQQLSLIPILKAWIPLLRWIPSDRDRKIDAAQKTMGRIGSQLLHDAKAAVISSHGAEKGGSIEKSSLQGRDLLSLLVRANMATDIPENQRISDEDVLAQVPTFLVAGHETTSTATTWALYALCLCPDIQTKLREELLTLETETPSMDELIALPYLDAVVRETLRLHAPVPSTVRIAMKDDILPVDKPFTDKYGVVHDGIKISKGDPIFIPILAVNRSEAIWGTDAKEFNPDRWASLPEVASQVPGVWGHLMTFLGGPRACIGYRFSLVEMKALLFTLVRAFEFELAVPASDIGKRSTIVQRPFLRSDPENKSQLPLLVKPYCKT
ncbi:cytochrome P450 [Suillus subalutaceus]|uniref:cytochrome P450 n=1 Tax=Suillus subalutaceus TaxID=48586 RepID=UPI001B882547|nr:cytochrome P450 [Suillus subalutaceus]KAG1855644.1 cytochrome P450 [Suillus subalutaceus]KAG1888114.1 cytochrome P450 [Suillus subluteus]